MKKLKITLAGLVALCLSLGVVNAQSGTSKSAPVKQSAPAKKTTKSAKSTGTTATPAKHLKKDGTPDMRYKENREAAGKTTGKKAKKAPATKSAKPATSATPAK